MERKIMVKIEVEQDENGVAKVPSKAWVTTNSPLNSTDQQVQEFDNVHDALIVLTDTIIHAYTTADKMMSGGGGQVGHA